MYIISIIVLCIGPIKAQQITYYKDKKFKKVVREKNAKFKKVETKKGDTLIIQHLRIKDKLIISESKWVGNKPCGVWTKFDLGGDLISRKDFTMLVYSDKKVEGIYHSDDSCENCENASFPGGRIALFKYIQSKLSYPEASKRMGSSGNVIIRFIVEKDGSVVPHSISKGVDPYIDLLTWDIIGSLPDWRPATKNNEPIRSVLSLPIKFRLG